MNDSERQALQDDAVQEAVRTRLHDPNALLTRYVLVAEAVRSDTGERVLWRMSGRDGLAGWDVDGLLYAGLHGEFADPDEDDPASE